MNQMEEAKRSYDAVPIPQELSERVLSEIKKADLRRKGIQMLQKKRMAKRTLASAAAAVVLFTGALNTSTAFAETVSTLPVIGAVAKVLTFRSWETETDDLKISVEIPSVEMIAQEFKGIEKSVNEEIHGLCQKYADEAVKRAEEYKAAFLATGGTEEEWAAHNIQIQVGYEVKNQTEDYLSLLITGNENWSSAYSEMRYYNFDLKKGQLLTLKDMLGSSYAEKAEASIRSQMEERQKAQNIGYWEEIPAIDENTHFYVNEQGNPVIVFEAYEVAPGSEGAQEFEIVK